jgi:hypothetical protein
MVTRVENKGRWEKTLLHLDVKMRGLSSIKVRKGEVEENILIVEVYNQLPHLQDCLLRTSAITRINAVSCTTILNRKGP